MAIFGEGNGTPLQYSCLENPMEGVAWGAAVHGVATSRTCWATSLSIITFTLWRRKWMAAHSSVLAWRIPGTGEPRGLSSMGSHKVGHDWSDLAAAAAWQSYKIKALYSTALSLWYSSSCDGFMDSSERKQKLIPGRRYFFFFFLTCVWGVETGTAIDKY